MAGSLTMARRQRGVTLVELVITIVIIGIAAAAVLGVYTTTIRASADPMIRAQALSVAELYMDEIMGRPFSGSTGDGNCGSREDWDHVAAYDGLDCQPEDVFGNPLSGLDMLTVSISVADDNSLGIGGGNERRIDVQVSDNAGTVNITLTAWRTREN